MRVAPLPIKARVYAGEDIDSYAPRLAARNHTTVTDIERALAENGLLVSFRGHDALRLQVWRQLGNLDPTAFTAPTRLDGQRIKVRTLCYQCAQGNHAQGRLLRVGHICIRHHRWLGEPQISLRSFPEAIDAERHFRRNITAGGVLFDGEIMQTCRQAATSGISPEMTEARAHSTQISINRRDILTYPEQVKLAAILCDHTFMSRLSDPRRAHSIRYAELNHRVCHIIDNNQSWRATNRLWAVAQEQARARGRQ